MQRERSGVNSDLEYHFERSPTILLVDDNSENLRVLSEALASEDFKIAVALDGESAIEQVNYRQPDMILLDIMMPGINGFEVCRRISKNSLSQQIPVIFMTALDDMESKVKGLSLGAVDYVTKPFQREEVLARVKTHLRVCQFSKHLEKKNQLLKAEVVKREAAESSLLELNEVLRQQRDLARITLTSISDGVITADAAGYVQTLNPVAAKITGWTEPEAKLYKISEVFQVINEQDDEIVQNPAEQALIYNKTVETGGTSYLLVARNKKRFVVEVSASPIRSINQKVEGVVLVFRDVTQARRMVKEMAWQASYDHLTRLVNRYGFEKRFLEAVEALKESFHTHCLCFVDLDRFKIVNDVCGHSAGDELLKQVSDIFRESFRQVDTIARIGGDEFVILLNDCSVEQAKEIVEKLVYKLDRFRFVFDKNIFSIGLSVGIVELTTKDVELSDVLSQADSACYAAKKKGGQRIQIFQNSDYEISSQRQEARWIVKLNSALDRDLFCLHFQPIRALRDSKMDCIAYEVLLRMKNEQGGLIPPAAFFPAAERYGITVKIDRWVIRQLFRKYGQKYLSNDYSEFTFPDSPFFMINLSGTSLNDDHLADFIEEQLDIYRICPSKICFEITETVAISNYSRTTQLINRLQNLGCRFALDDFGSGMSSFGYLKNLPVSFLKIDGTLVREALENQTSLTIVESINRISKTMGIQTIAECIETRQLKEEMTSMGIDYGQGYWLGKPMPASSAYWGCSRPVESSYRGLGSNGTETHA